MPFDFYRWKTTNTDFFIGLPWASSRLSWQPSSRGSFWLPAVTPEGQTPPWTARPTVLCVLLFALLKEHVDWQTAHVTDLTLNTISKQRDWKDKDTTTVSEWTHLNRVEILCVSMTSLQTRFIYHTVFDWLFRWDAGLQLPPWELSGDHCGAQLLQVSLSLWASRGMGYEQGILTGLYGTGRTGT